LWLWGGLIGFYLYGVAVCFLFPARRGNAKQMKTGVKLSFHVWVGQLTESRQQISDVATGLRDQILND